MRGAQRAAPGVTPVSPVEQDMGEFDLIAFKEADLAEIRADITELDELEQSRGAKSIVASPVISTAAGQKQEHTNTNIGQIGQKTTDSEFDLIAFMEADLAEIRADITELEQSSAVDARTLTASPENLEFENEARSDTKAPAARREQKQPSGLWRQRIGYFALGCAITVGSLFGVDEFVQPSDKPTLSAAGPKTDEPVSPDSVPALSSTSSTEATTSSTEATSTTEAEIYSTFEVNNGELIGVLKIPEICEEIQVLQASEQEKIDDLPGTGRAILDLKTEDPTPNNGCAPIEEWERANRDIKDRTEWKNRPSAVGEGNPDGSVNYWQPVATFDVRPDGKLMSPYPGVAGNTLISGHGSTYSAPFAALGTLEPGDQAVFERADGRTFTYTAVGSEIVASDDLYTLLNYSHPDNPATLTLYMCSDEDGNTGSAARRTAVRFVMTGTSY